ncbi:MAG TPA: hypothetical protein VIT02_00260 [Burkholderiaceae bacterium]
MNEKTSTRLVRASVLALGLSALLGACYVVPMNPDGSPAWQYLPPPPPAAGAPVAAPPAMPAMASSYQARLYPMNELAAQSGQLVATIADLHTGRGVLSMTMAGEFLTGEATRVSDSHPGFGAVYQRVLRTPIKVAPGQPRGIANATGSRGTWVNCEYVLEQSGRGTGACMMSNGAAYQIHFGN